MELNKNKRNTLLLTVVLFFSGILVWELSLRSYGYGVSFDDGKEFWAHQRRKVYQSKEKTTVFIGSSRIKYDLDADSWIKETGEIPIQLACVGSTPIPVLNDLAADNKFKGKLIIDVTEKLFYNFKSWPREKPVEGLLYNKSETYAQKISYYIDQFLQTFLVSLDKENFTLTPLINKLPIPQRIGVDPNQFFPVEFERINKYRQSFMTDRFAHDTSQTRKVQGLWKLYGNKSKMDPPIQNFKIDSLMGDIKLKVDKIKKRGGEVIFTRTPSTGAELSNEINTYPREKYWQKLLDITQCQGIHYADYSELASLTCPEFSHLDKRGARVYTKKLISILKEKFRWKFNKVL